MTELREVPIGDGVNVYIADEAGEAFAITDAELALLHEYEERDQANGYSLWCADTGRLAEIGEIRAACARLEADLGGLPVAWRQLLTAIAAAEAAAED
jgi:hypothetical protein